MGKAMRGMKSYSVPVPKALDLAVQARMRAGGFNSVAECVRSATWADLERAGELGGGRVLAEEGGAPVALRRRSARKVLGKRLTDAQARRASAR